MIMLRQGNIICVSLIAIVAVAFVGTANATETASIASAAYVAKQIQPVETKIDNHVADGDVHVTTAQKTAWSGKQDAIADLETIRAGAALGATSIQSHQDISGKENSSNKVTATTGYDTTSTTLYPSMATTQAMISSGINTNNTNLAGQINGKVNTVQGSGKANLAVITNSSGNITTGTIATGMITDGAVTSGKIADGTISNADISDTAAIAPSKIATDASNRFVSDTEKSTWSGKQDALTTAQLNAVNSGATSAKIDKIGTATITAKGADGTTVATDLSAAVNAIDARLSNVTSTADGAIQTITTGATDGTIAVDGTDIAVRGLKSAAYTEASAYDAAGSASAAETAAKTYAKNYADSLATNYDAAGTAAAIVDALNLADTYDAKGAAATALQDAKDYADGLATNYDAAGSASAAETAAKTYAKNYADGLATNYDAAGSASAAETAAKAYTDTEVAKKQNKSTGVSVGGANGAWNTLANGNGITITTANGTTTIATAGNYITVPAASGTSGKSVLTYDADTTTYYWESIGR